jgi:hypothetical protein
MMRPALALAALSLSVLLELALGVQKSRPGSTRSAAAAFCPGKFRWAVKTMEDKLKPDEDGDIHLVIADPATGETMIAEFPDTTCAPASTSPKKTQMTKARNAFAAACKGLPPTGHFERLQGTATIIGVGFFDANHGQKGVAKTNAIELHPVLSFTKATCSPSTT